MRVGSGHRFCADGKLSHYRLMQWTRESFPSRNLTKRPNSRFPLSDIPACLHELRTLPTELSDFDLPVNCKAACIGDWVKKRELGLALKEMWKVI